MPIYGKPYANIRQTVCGDTVDRILNNLRIFTCPVCVAPGNGRLFSYNGLRQHLENRNEPRHERIRQQVSLESVFSSRISIVPDLHGCSTGCSGGRCACEPLPPRGHAGIHFRRVMPAGRCTECALACSSSCSHSGDRGQAEAVQEGKGKPNEADPGRGGRSAGERQTARQRERGSETVRQRKRKRF